MNITTQRAAELIRNSNGKMFTVTVKKRSNGKLRTMNGRLGVTKFLNPQATRRNYTPANHNIIPIAENVPGNRGTDDDNMQYRAIAIEGIKRLKINRMEFTVVDELIAAMSK
jgi:hypothetical protein